MPNIFFRNDPKDYLFPLYTPFFPNDLLWNPISN